MCDQGKGRAQGHWTLLLLACSFPGSPGAVLGSGVVGRHNLYSGDPYFLEKVYKTNRVRGIGGILDSKNTVLDIY